MSMGMSIKQLEKADVVPAEYFAHHPDAQHCKLKEVDLWRGLRHHRHLLTYTSWGR